jgi:hypothetical protein
LINEPIYVAGPDRSGTTLMFALLASHPNISMVRRTNMWRYFYNRYGDLHLEKNFECCLQDMIRYNRMRHLKPDPERIRKEFWEGEPSYGRLFALFHKHNAERSGKLRWGDKSLHTELFTEQVVREFPRARIIHMTRDPRDRYASVRKRSGKDTHRIGAATARWLFSMQAARRNIEQYRENYLVVPFETLTASPEATVREICGFIGENFSEKMLSMQGGPEHRERGGNSSFGGLEPGVISTRPVGRFREVLSPKEIAFIQLVAGRVMKAFGYALEPVQMSLRLWIEFYLFYLPYNFARLVGWTGLMKFRIKRGIQIPARRLSEEPVVTEQKITIRSRN